MTDDTNASTTRRGVMKGVGGLAAISMSGVTITKAQEILGQDVPTDPHTRDTYRSVVDAIIPRTPELADEINELTGEPFGEEHVAGGLDVDLEQFIIWDFNHFQEIRSETVAPAGTEPSGAQLPPSAFEVDLDTTSAGSDLEALATLGNGPSGVDGVDLAALEEHLTFGPVERLEVSFADLDAGGEGIETFELRVRTSEETHHQVLQNYPYANLFPFAFDLAAADLIARGENEDPPSPNSEFPGGGTFVRLSREDRLRALWSIVDGGTLDRLDEFLSPLFTDLGLLKFTVMAVNGLHGFGYYTEWSGYGDTKMNTPSEREVQVDPGEVQSRVQTGYPGPSDGYAADWRHPVEGGFTDNWDTGEPAGPVDVPDRAHEESDEATSSGGTVDDAPDGSGDEVEGGGESSDDSDGGDSIADALGGDLL